MNIAVRRSPLGVSTPEPGSGRSPQTLDSTPREAQPAPGRSGEGKARVYVAAENRLLREALARMLTKRGSIEVIGLDSAEPFRSQALLEWEADVLLLVSRGNLEEDLAAIREAHAEAPSVRILLIGTTKENGEFLQCVRAGISGYLWRDASADDVLEGIRAVRAGEAVCPGALCTVLFRYFEHEASPLPCAGVRQRLGFTRREQQLIPLIAKGSQTRKLRIISAFPNKR